MDDEITLRRYQKPDMSIVCFTESGEWGSHVVAQALQYDMYGIGATIEKAEKDLQGKIMGCITLGNPWPPKTAPHFYRKMWERQIKKERRIKIRREQGQR